MTLRNRLRCKDRSQCLILASLAVQGCKSRSRCLILASLPGVQRSLPVLDSCIAAAGGVTKSCTGSDLCIGNDQLIRQIIFHGSDYAHFLQVGVVLVAVLNAEKPLLRIFDFAKLTVAVVGKLLGDLPSVLSRLLYHVGLNVVQASEQVLGPRLIIVARQ